MAVKYQINKVRADLTDDTTAVVLTYMVDVFTDGVLTQVVYTQTIDAGDIATNNNLAYLNEQTGGTPVDA